jgi:AraC-like DNA-binding protein
LRIDPLLVRLVEKFTDELGDVAREQRTAELAAPFAQWRGRDAVEFVNRLRRATGDEFMRLAAAPCAPGCTDLMIEVSCRCYTLREALSFGARLLAIATSGVRIELSESADEAILEFTAEPTSSGSERGLVDWLMILWHKRSQWLIGSEIWLDHTEFAHALDDDYSNYALMFGGDCVFNAKVSRLRFARSYLDRRIVRTPADGEHMKAWMPGFFGKPVGLSRTWKQLVKSVLRVQIATGEPPSSVDQLATEFGVGSQVLRRRLRAEGVNYRTIKAQVREELALDVLADSQATLAEASLAAGFAEPNALTRALKASKGISATQLRNEVKHWRGAGAAKRTGPETRADGARSITRRTQPDRGGKHD